ncbi:hypothetical protein RRG08_024564 [Elysia crispata]|uniref:Alpha/beta hydrolase fold-3 domain-containing protein n=1 Tax=Elysia crispata TaxID=231223 RepID=A0AAE0ZY66_9GAST|nr:hypothetical protein RRG08_024564 [Elysia crispata]
MIIRGLVLTTAALVALLAFLAYEDLPEAIEDRYRAMLFVGVYKLLTITPFEFLDFIGYGSLFDNMKEVGRFPEPDLSSDPHSASFGIMEVTRDKLAGVQVIVYRPKHVAEGEMLPGLIYFHGGGWCMHHPDIHDKTTHQMANCTRKVLISVDYRLAPANPFPIPVEDCLDVTKHLLKHGKSLGIDVNNIAISGDSAGGNLAAAVTLALAKEKNSGLPALKYQILAYPVTQALNLRLPSMVEIGERIPLPSAQRMAGFWAAYLGLDSRKLDECALIMKYNHHVPPQLLNNSKYSKYLDVQNLPEKFRKPRPEIMGSYFTPPEKAGVISSYDAQLYDQIKDTLVNPLLSPLMATDLSGLPPALVVVAEFDVLRDEGLLYAHRLREAGVKTDVYITRGYHCDFIHMFPSFLHSKTGEKTLNAMCSFMEREGQPIV